MKNSRKCPQCGRIFIATKATMTYCSPECRDAARRKKDAARHRETRARASQDRKTQQAARRQTQTQEAEQNAQRARDSFQARLDAGDPRALMLQAKAHGGNLNPDYWRYFQAAEIQEAEDAGRTCRTLINGHSPYESNFVEAVLQSIQATGQIIASMAKGGPNGR